MIRLVDSQISFEDDKYEIEVMATDDGTCCVESGTPVDPKDVHTSTAVVVVAINRKNKNKPIFEDCSSYAPKIEEGSPVGSPVIKVHAVDKDKGLNGRVKYSISTAMQSRSFTIDEETGEIFTKTVFDSENKRQMANVPITVKAVDFGDPSLEGSCTFNVEIVDVNDNSPVFDRQKYIENVKRDTEVGAEVLKVSASDKDSGSSIRYSLFDSSKTDVLDFFDIGSDSGRIILKKPLEVNVHTNTQTITLHLSVRERGTNSK